MRYLSFPLLLVLFGWVWVASLVIAGLLGANVRRHHFESAGLVFGVATVVYALVALRRSGTAPACSGTAPAYRHRPTLQFTTWIPGIVAVGAFGWTIGLGPLSDDYVLANWAQRGDFVPIQWPYVRPLPLALWHVILSFGGSWSALHALNITLHACNALAVGILARRRLGITAGLVAGAVFAMFPAATEAVAWNASVFDLLATSFVLIAVLLSPRARASAGAAAGLAVACAGGALSKETAVAIPALIALDAFLASTADRDFKRLALPIIISVAVIGACLGARTLVTPSMSSHLDNLPGGRREIKDLITRPYAALTVPFRTENGIGAEHYVAAAALLLLLGVSTYVVGRGSHDAIRTRRKEAETLLLAFGWSALASWPLLSQFYVSPALEGSRYTYLPSVGLALVVAAAVGRPPAARGRVEIVAWLSIALVIVTYAHALLGERSIWNDAASQRERFLSNAASLIDTGQCSTVNVRNAPDNVRGVYLFREGLPEAIDSLPKRSPGRPCTLIWTGSELALQ